MSLKHRSSLVGMLVVLSRAGCGWVVHSFCITFGDLHTIGLCVVACHLMWCALFARVEHCWNKRRSNQALMWHSDMLKSGSLLASVGAPQLPGWSPTDGECCWLEKCDSEPTSVVQILYSHSVKSVRPSYPPKTNKHRKKIHKLWAVEMHNESLSSLFRHPLVFSV